MLENETYKHFKMHVKWILKIKHETQQKYNIEM